MVDVDSPVTDAEEELVDAVVTAETFVGCNCGNVNVVNPGADCSVPAWAELVVVEVDAGCPIEGNVNIPRGDAPGADTLFTDNPGDPIIRGTAPEAAVASDEVDPLLAGFTGDDMNTNGAGTEGTADVGGKVNTIGVTAAAAVDEVILPGTETVRDEEAPRTEEETLLTESVSTVSEVVAL